MKILIIKIGAKGDVVRTLPILLAIKEKYPDSEISWVTKPDSQELLKVIPEINRVILIPCNTNEKFDILYNFDTEGEATKLAKEASAGKKYGFYEENGYPAAFNLSAEYYLNTMFDDELKKTNKKTYQEMMFEAAELPWKRQHYFLILSEDNMKYAEKFAKENKINAEKLIGIHIGAGKRWPSKAWHKNKIIEFIKKAKEKDYEILLFSGPDEKDKHEEIFNKLKKESINIYKNNPQNSDLEFASLINLCKVIVCPDSFALHISLTLKKPTIALFFCNSPDEVEGYGLLKKIVSPLLYNFFPEKQDQFSEELVNSIPTEEVLKAIKSFEDDGRA